MLNQPQENLKKIGEPANFPIILANIHRLVSYDPGLARETKYRKRALTKSLAEGPVLILNRSAFIAERLEDFNKDKTAKGVFFMFDLADMHFADKAGAGDLVLNRFARDLRSVIEEFRSRKSSDLGDAKVSLCRYGGDEFCISLTGQFDHKLVSELKEAVETRYKQNDLHGFFKKGLKPDDPTVERPIKLKERADGEAVEIIERPHDVKGKEIFDSFMKRGQILPLSQINKALRNPDFVKFIEKPVEFFWGTEFISAIEKLSYLAKRFPELQPEIEKLKNNQITDFQRLEAVDFLQARLFDKLFGDIVFSNPEFVKRIKNYSDIFCFDIKLIREMNEIVSFPEADMVINKLYEEINSRLGRDLAGSVDIGRRGGTFFIGIKKDILTQVIKAERIRQALSGITGMSLNLRGQIVNLEIGIDSIRGDKEFSDDDFRRLNDNAEIDFFNKTARYLGNTDETGITNAQRIFMFKDFKKDSGQINFVDSLLQEFFISKRSLLRTNKMLQVIQSDEDFYGKEYNQLRQIMNIIYKYADERIDSGKIDQDELLQLLQSVFQ